MHEAIGTSIVLMACIALIGAVAHYLYQPFSLVMIGATSGGAMLGAGASALIANRLKENTLRLIAGIVFVLLGTALTVWFVVGLF